MDGDAKRNESTRADRLREWAVLGEWLASPPPLLHKVDLDVLQERLTFMGRARACLAAAEADVIAEVSRREGDAAAEETLRRTQKRSRAGARKAVKTAAQLEWAPRVAGKLADGAITPEAAGLILDAAGETPVDHGTLLDAAEEEPDDLFRKTLKEHVNERTSEEELEARRARQRRRRRASISEQADGMFHLYAQFDPLTGNRVRNALLAKSDELFRSEDSKNRATYPQRFADALAELICNSDGDGAPAGVELIILADYDSVHDQITNARLTDETRLTEAETLAIACDAKILPGIFNKHTGDALLGRSQAQDPQVAAQTAHRPRRRLHRLRRPPQHLPGPPHPPLETRRRNHPRKHLPRVLALPPRPHPPTRRTNHPPPRRTTHLGPANRHTRRRPTHTPTTTRPPPTPSRPDRRHRQRWNVTPAIAKRTSTPSRPARRHRQRWNVTPAIAKRTSTPSRPARRHRQRWNVTPAIAKRTSTPSRPARRHR